MTKLLPILIALMLMGQSCEPKPQQGSVSPGFCDGNDYTISGAAKFGWERGEVGGTINAILHGNPSQTVRSTVQVRFGGAYCTGTVLSPRIVLTAGHCGYGATTAHTIKVFERDTAPASEDSAVPPSVAYASSETGELVDGPGDDAFAFNAGGLDAAQGGGLKLVHTGEVLKHVVHSDYMKYVNSGNTYYEGRSSDLMVLHLAEDVPLPAVAGPYNEAWAPYCNGSVAQGFGRHNIEGLGLDLRETKYVITDVREKLLVSRAFDLPPGVESGRTCYGDSGGALYCDVGGVVYLCGVTTTTMSSDCEAGGSHVRVSAFWDSWIEPTMVELST